ncbi:GtrA family protein [Rufibacter sediminis]|uniref:GtrA family protein n=1 Tax=Rufibacter sediminis TaxID=2762756 RepID=A0ABR6VYZ9_9BACT|nr:GtrA family protein [Rufibacter sediminis]MBC3542390.1 GtrA family protein [Rufibacter sediminis]
MLTFLKAQAASVGATIVDFLVTVLAVEVFGSWYVMAAVLGTASGGVAHFSLSREWVFQAEDSSVVSQAIKYFIIWSGSLFLNAAGVFLITHHTGISYIISKVITSLVVGMGYNYQMQKKFVFRKNTTSTYS